jgi:hypothetical protein
MRKVLLAVGVLFALSACSLVQDPVGTGSATDSLPKSPCACDAPFYVNGEWVG